MYVEERWKRVRKPLTLNGLGLWSEIMQAANLASQNVASRRAASSAAKDAAARQAEANAQLVAAQAQLQAEQARQQTAALSMQGKTKLYTMAGIGVAGLLGLLIFLRKRKA